MHHGPMSALTTRLRVALWVVALVGLLGPKLAHAEPPLVFPPPADEVVPPARTPLSTVLREDTSELPDTSDPNPAEPFQVLFPEQDRSYYRYLAPVEQTTITVVFNRDMVATDRVGKSSAEGPVRFEPPLAGSFVWTTPRRLDFSASKPWANGQEHTATIAKGTKSLPGESLEEDFTWVATLVVGKRIGGKLVGWLPKKGKPKIVMAFPSQGASDNHLSRQVPLLLVFDQAVTPGRIKPWVKVTSTLEGAEPVAVPFSLKPYRKKTMPKTYGGLVDTEHPNLPARHALLLTPRRPWPNGAAISLVLADRLAQDEDDVDRDGEDGLDYVWEQLMQVEFGTPERLELDDVSCPPPDDCTLPPEGRPVTVVKDFKGTLDLRFKGAIDRRTLAKAVSVRPKPAHLAVGATVEEGSEQWRIRVSMRLVPGKRYTLSVSRKLTDFWGFPLHKPVRFTVIGGDHRPTLKIPAGPVTVESHADYVAETMNMDSASLEIQPIPPERVAAALAWLARGSLLTGMEAPRTVTLEPSARKNRWGRQKVPLGAGGKRTPGLYAVTLKGASPELDNVENDEHRGRSLVQVTDLGISSKRLSDSLVVWVTRLRTSAPAPGARVRVYSEKGGKEVGAATTDAAGVALLTGGQGLDPDKDGFIIVATSGDQVAYHRFDPSKALRPWYFQLAPAPARDEDGELSEEEEEEEDDADDQEEPSGALAGMVATDRGVYRPGETLLLKTYLRDRKGGRLTLPASGAEVAFVVYSPAKEPVATLKAALSAVGSADASWRVPEGADLGRYTVEVTLAKALAARTSVLVSEFRKPTFTVAVSPSAPTLQAGATLVARVAARYLFGAALAGGPVSWTLTSVEATHTPPGYPGYSFGQPPKGSTPAFVSNGQGKTDASGGLAVTVPIPRSSSGRPTRYRLEAQVQDVDRQAIANRASVLAHPGAFYLGLRVDRAVPSTEAPLAVDAIAVTPTGAIVPRVAVEIDLVRLATYWRWEMEEDWHYGARNEVREEAVGSCKRKLKRGRARCIFRPHRPGRYRLRARATDPAGNAIVTTHALDVAGEGDAALPRGSAVRLDMSLENGDLVAGEAARLTVKNPFARAHGLLTVERGGVLYRRVVELPRGVQTLTIPTTEDLAPNAFVALHLVSARSTEALDGAGRDIGAPQYRVGYVPLRVRTAARRLAVSVSPQRLTYEPRDEVVVDLQTRTHTGAGSPAELTVAVVDEGVLSLTAYRTPDPIEAMYPRRDLRLWTHDSRRGLLGDVFSFVHKGAPGGGGWEDDDAELEGGAAPTPRSNFVSTVFWAPSVMTDANGRAQVRFRLPDDVTTFRVMVLAADPAGRFGSGEGRLVSRKPFIVRAALPRFLAVGDRAELGLVLQNQTDDELLVDVKATVDGLVASGPLAGSVRLAPHGTDELSFDVDAVVPGEARLLFSAVAQGQGRELRDAVERVLPVEPLVTWRVASLSLETKTRREVELRYPQDLLPSSEATLELEVSTDLLQGLGAGLEYLVRYPYGCVEQTTSSTLPLLALIDVLPSIGVTRHAPEKLLVMAGKGIARLGSMQVGSGGLAYWPGGKHAHLYGSAYATLALTEASRRGLPKARKLMEGVASYLQKALRAGEVGKGWAGGSGADIQAYVTYVLATAGIGEHAYVSTLFSQHESMSLFGKSFLGLAMHLLGSPPDRLAAVVSSIRSEINDDGSLVRPQRRMDYRTFSSDERSGAVALLALVTLGQDLPVVHALVRQLSRSRKGSRWRTTQQTAWVLLGVAAYARRFIKPAPPGKARFEVRLDGKVLPLSTFAKVGGSIQRRRLPIEGLEKRSARLEIRSLSGDTRIFAGLRTRFTSRPRAKLDAERSKGVTVYKRLETLDRVPIKGPITAGETVRVRIVFSLPKAMQYLVVDDPLPAGLEAVDTQLAVSAQDPDALEDAEYDDDDDRKSADPDNARRHATKEHLSHSEVRDDRVTFFADDIPAGLWEVSYLARATVRGSFGVAPARAEAMYEPDRHGTSEMGKVVIR